MPGVEEGLDAESIARGEQAPPRFVPKDKRELTPEMLQALHAEIFIEVQRNLAVGSRAETMVPPL
jgi:hypothetical protein